MMGLRFTFGILLLSVVNCKDGKGNYKVEVEKLIKAIQGSSLIKDGLTGTVAPSADNNEKNELLNIPSEDEVKRFIVMAEENFQKIEDQNIEFAKIDKLNKETPVFGPHLLTDDESIRINKHGNIMATATANIVENARRQKEKKRKNFLNSTTRFQIFDLLERLRFSSLDSCPYGQPISCDSAYQYRTIDGSCNNINNPYWGKSHTPFERFLTPQYEGTSDPRAIAKSGRSLPGAREISVMVHTPSNDGDADPDISYMVMQWGQFTDHDITKTAISKGYGNRNIECCNIKNKKCSDKENRDCCEGRNIECCAERNKECCDNENNNCCVKGNGDCCNKINKECCEKGNEECCDKEKLECCDKRNKECCDKGDEECCDKEKLGCCDKRNKECCDKGDEECCDKEKLECCDKRNKECCDKGDGDCCDNENNECCVKWNKQCCSEETKNCCDKGNKECCEHRNKECCEKWNEKCCDKGNDCCDKSNIECCMEPDDKFTRSDCFPINIPAGDPYYPPSKTCLNFVRSTVAPALDCSTDYRQQLNELTHFIDASNVYGSTATQLSVLRDGTTEKMKMSTDNRLPLDDQNDSECILSDPVNKKCFLAGDKRANVQPGLSSMHTIFVREHNRIADFIKTNNPSWTDEKVFQEARRFVSAEMQHITYNEFLPKILHNFFMTFFDLKPKALGYFGGYDTTIKPMIRNAFATAAYRFGHSLLQDRFTWGSSFPFLHTQFNNPDLLYPLQGIEKCTGGLYEEKSQGMDEKLTTEVTNKLFKTMTDLGGDLAAFNIQRGRDHGLPSYNYWLDGCYGIKATTFEVGVPEGLPFHSYDKALKLKDAYEHPNDMDLFTAAISEKNMPGSKLGPTFSCILALQFHALKYGDRFFYEGNTTHNPHPFTLPELDSIRQVTLAKIICNNTDITSLPKDVFLLPNTTTNQNIQCSDMPSLKLQCTPVHGGWSNWISGSRCTQLYRTCTNPRPNACGNECMGESIKLIHDCAVEQVDDKRVQDTEQISDVVDHHVDKQVQDTKQKSNEHIP